MDGLVVNAQFALLVKHGAICKTTVGVKLC